MKSEKKDLFQNTFMLYIMRFSLFFFAFIITPYLTRVLGVSHFGKVGVANALMMYFYYLIDFGFMLSGTQEVAQNETDKERVGKIYSSIQILKLGLTLLAFIILGIIFMVSPKYRSDALFFSAFLLATAINVLIPSHIFRGVQRMSAVTTAVLVSQIVYVVGVFLLVKQPADYIYIPFIKLAGETCALLFSMYYLRAKLDIHFIKVRIDEIKSHFVASSTYFLSRIAGSVHNNLNILLLNRVSPASAGLYTVSNKLVSTGQAALSPLSDSIFPYMTQYKDFKLIKKILLYLEPVIILGCAIVGYFANDFTALLFGAEFYEAGDILRALMPAAIVTLPQLLLGFPTMAALGITNFANYSIYFSSSVHVVILLIMFATGHFSPINLARLVSFTACVDLLFRAYFVRKAYKRHLARKATHPSGGQDERSV